MLKTTETIIVIIVCIVALYFMLVNSAGERIISIPAFDYVSSSGDKVIDKYFDENAGVVCYRVHGVIVTTPISCVKI